MHDMENVLEDGELHFMYDRAYGDIKFGTIHAAQPTLLLHSFSQRR
jgi:hypothetical protein